VICKLQLGWSPEQIAGRLPHDHPELRISHEAIYQYIYNPHVRKTRELIPLLVRSHKKRQARGHTKKHRKSHIPDRIPIDRRPAYVEKRQQPGHWESDTIISRQSKEAIGVCLERSTRFVHLAKLEKKGAADLAEAINRRLGRHPPHMRRTITYDNGSENARICESIKCSAQGPASATPTKVGSEVPSKMSSGSSADTCPRKLTSQTSLAIT